MRPLVLYLSMIRGSPSHERKLAGIRRYCGSRGWVAEPVFREDVSAELLPGILAGCRPVGCVVDGVGRHAVLLPRLFRGIPVSYIGYLPGETGRRPNFRFDAPAIAKAAFRELSAARPECYATVGFVIPFDWSRRRIRSFRAAAASAGARCFSFPPCPSSGRRGGVPETWDAFVERLVPWLAALPEHCAVFAVSDQTAVRVAHAAHLAGRHVPRSLTLLSVDNFTELCETATPPVSSIQLDFEREGYLAAKILDDARQAPPGSPPAPIPAIRPLMVVRRKSTSGHGRHEKFILDAVETIRREACDGLTAADLIAHYPVSKRLFTLRFREAIGHSVLDEILHVRLEKVCTLLSRTDTAIGAIPLLCGFRTNSALDDLFRARFGMSMRSWRKANRQ